MSTIRFSLVTALLIGAAGCYQEPAYAQGTIPQQPPQEMQGPPGGAMDPGYGYGAPQQAQPDDQTAEQPADPNAQAYVDPNDPNAQNAQQPDPYGGDSYGADYGTGEVTDPQIDATLDGYGTWETDEDYGRVWYPDTTVVGVNFTPYETCGSWVWSDQGWLYTCDYSWGWLPFHYGRWGWFDNRWGWVPGYQWGPAWVDWRYGGGYIGWRPLAPQWKDGREWHVRDHRHGVITDSHWRFAGEREFSQGHIHGHLFQNPAEGLRVTNPMRPPTPHDIAPVRAQAVMQAHMPPHPLRTQSHFGTQPTRPWQPGHETPFRGPQPTWHAPQQAYSQPFRGPQQQPTWRGPQQTWRAPQQPTWHQPQQGVQPPAWHQPQQPTWHQPQQAVQPPAWHQPQQPTWHQPQQPTWHQPQQPAWHPTQQPAWRGPQPTYHAPVQAYRPPTPSYSPPARTYSPPARSYSAPTYSAPSHSYSAPSHSYSAPSHSYSAPSHSSSSSSHSSGGGGHHR